MQNDKLLDLAIAVIGGGTGLPVLLRGIKRLTNNIAAIVTVADDGGSSGRLRADFGIIPTGDLRNCLIALAETEPIMEKLFQHRFEGSGDLAGHSVGNLLIAALINITGDAELALKQTSKVLAVRGSVLPSATEKVTLAAKMADGSFIEGESKISAANKKIERVFLKPADAPAAQSAVETILAADICILGPGSLYTSVMPNLLLEGIAAALKKTAAAKIYICNVMTQPGETEGYNAYDHVKAIFDHVGSGMIDYVLVNSKEIAPELKDIYALEGARPVTADVGAIKSLGVTVIEADLISETNLVRHDPIKLSKSIIALINDLNLERKSSKA
ncbi:MAG: YvcK family protein [Sporomusaceae bacterium]|nr:YvcK family protein [Sporomusaceae bacterium]